MKVERDPNLSPGVPSVTNDADLAAQTAASYRERRERGSAARRVAPRTSHAAWAPATDRPDPVDLLEAQAKDRLPDLIPIRYARHDGFAVRIHAGRGHRHGPRPR